MPGYILTKSDGTQEVRSAPEPIEHWSDCAVYTSAVCDCGGMTASDLNSIKSFNAKGR